MRFVELRSIKRSDFANIEVGKERKMVRKKGWIGLNEEKLHWSRIEMMESMNTFQNDYYGLDRCQ
jgi:hypothetical protein